MIGQANGNKAWAPILRGLDRRYVCDRLNACINWPDGVRVVAVKIRRFLPGRRWRFQIEYELLLQSVTNGQEHLQRTTLFARSVDTDAGAGMPIAATATPRVSDSGASRLFGVDNDLGFSLHSADCDPSLAEYNQCMDAAWMFDRLRRLGLVPRPSVRASGVGHRTLHCERVAFRLGRRFLIRYELNGGCAAVRWAGKCYADHRGERLAELQRQLYEQLMSITGGRVRPPRLINYDNELRMVLSVWEDSKYPHAGQRTGESAQLAAECLAAIQATSPTGLTEVDPSNRAQTVERWNTCIQRLLPELAAQAELLTSELSHERAEDITTDPVVIHRDYYESQLVMGREGAVVLDLDTLAIGDRCVDVGNYLAHQWLWCLERGLGMGEYRKIAETFLDSYEQSTRPLDDRVLSCEWASSLFRVGAIHAFRDITSQYTHALWGLAQSVIKSGRRALVSSRQAPRRVTKQPVNFSARANEP